MKQYLKFYNRCGTIFYFGQHFHNICTIFAEYLHIGANVSSNFHYDTKYLHKTCIIFAQYLVIFAKYSHNIGRICDNIELILNYICEVFEHYF